ncbi:MAG: hypothetical protein ACRD2W_12095 [Acidimicrobiales bacterium]
MAADQAGWFSRKKAQAVGEKPAAPLKSRLNAGLTAQFEADAMLDGLLAAARLANEKPWSLATDKLTIAHQWWLVSVYWQVAAGHLNGVLAVDKDKHFIPPDVYAACEALIQVAEDANLQAVRDQSKVDVGLSIEPTSLQSLPDLLLDERTFLGVWQALEAVYTQVGSDQDRIVKLGVPKRFAPVFKTLVGLTQPNLAEFEQLQQHWMAASDASARLTFARRAVVPARELFTAGQQYVAPSLMGRLYTESKEARRTLDELELGVDPWMLVDPDQRAARKKNTGDVEKLIDFWQRVSRAEAVNVHRQLEEALKRDQVRRRAGRGYDTIPWSAQYLVRFPLTLGDRRFGTGDLIVFYLKQEPPDAWQIEIRRTGRVNQRLELLGHE